MRPPFDIEEGSDHFRRDLRDDGIAEPVDGIPIGRRLIQSGGYPIN